MVSIAITVLYFGAAHSETGVFSEIILLSCETTSHEEQPSFPLRQLGDILVTKYPHTKLKDILKTSRWSVEAELVEDETQVELFGGEEIAVLPPVSGG